MRNIKEITSEELKQIVDSLPTTSYRYHTFDLMDSSIRIFCTVDMLSVVVDIDFIDGQSSAWYESGNEPAFFPWIKFIRIMNEAGYLLW